MRLQRRQCDMLYINDTVPVILVTPPRAAAAPIMAYKPGLTQSTLGAQNRLKNPESLPELNNTVKA